MKALPYFAVAAQLVAKQPVGILKLESTLNSSASDALYVQIHDTIAVPAEGAVPIKSWPAGECQYKEFEHHELRLALGCYICLSSTLATKTLATGGSNIFDTLQIELNDPEVPSNTTVVGDLTTAVAGLQVWSEAAGASARKFLTGLEVDGTNLTTATQFIQIFATDTVTTGDTAMMSFPITIGQVRTLNNGLQFGDFGQEIFSIDSTTPFTKRLGCTVKISSTSKTFTACTGTAAIRAQYK